MGRVLLFAMIGGGLVVLIWLVAGQWIRRLRLRARAQALLDLQAERDRQAALLPGGSPLNAILIESPSVVEPKAGSMPCARCSADVRVEEHQVRMVDGQRFRVARVRCASCGHEREIFFQLGGAAGH